MGLLGSAVPLLRCPQHRPVLNLAVAGQIYESGADWTQRFWPLLPEGRYSLEFEKLAAFTSLRVVRIPQRASDTPAHLIDLTRYFNASLEEPWTENAKPVSLSALGGGVRVLDGVPFDVRGVIQLRGGLYSLRHFPPAASNITVGLRSAKLHFLHATTESARRKDSVAQIIVHYPDHAPVRFDFRYAVHLLNLRSDPHRDNRLQSMVDTRLAWSSPEDQPPEIHLYHTEWNNPHPELEISRIDYVSGTSPAGPVLLAITADPPPSTTMPSPPSSLPTNPEPRSPSL